MTVWKSGALASALLLAAAAGAAFMPAVHGAGDEPQRWDSEPLQKVVQLVGGAGQIGVSVREVDNDDTTQPKSGVVVEEVRSGSAADKAGVKDGDQIVEFDGERVRSVRQFTRLVQDTPIGRSVPVVVLRGGQRTTLNVAPTRGAGWRFDEDFGLISPPEPPMPPPAPEAPRPPTAAPPFPALPGFGFSYRSGGGRLGASVENLSDELTEYFGVKHGVLVRSVSDGSPAAKAGLKAGDVITSVNGTTVEEPSDVSRTLDRLEDQAEFTIDVMRDKKPLTLKGKLGARERSRSRAVV